MDSETPTPPRSLQSNHRKEASSTELPKATQPKGLLIPLVLLLAQGSIFLHTSQMGNQLSYILSHTLTLSAYGREC